LIVSIDVRSSDDGTRILKIAGSINLYSAVELQTALVALFENRHFELLIDLDDVRHIDSTGLEVLVGARQRVRANGGRIGFICADPLIRKLLDVTGVAKAFTIFRDERSAKSALAFAA
jgi:anti-sigma B factor antagonist